MLEGSLGYTDDKLLGSDEGIKLKLSDGKFLGTMFVNVDVITLGLAYALSRIYSNYRLKLMCKRSELD